MKENLLQRVEGLFGQTEQPKFITRRPLLEEDPYVMEIETRFKSKKVENLNLEDVIWLITDIIWLDEDALTYFFPKMLKTCIEKPHKLLNFDLLIVQLADKRVLKEKFGFINTAQAQCILEILEFWQRDKSLLEKFSIAEDLKEAIIYWKKRAKVTE